MERETLLKPLRIAAIVKNTPSSYERENKNVGYLSYPVPEFTWEYFSPGKGVRVDTREFQKQGYDLILHIDGGNWCEYIGNAIPTVYYSVDSTLSENHHFAPRYEQAAQADLILVDHDQLERFEATGRPVRRWLYCVNDRVFYPREKTLDVDFQCGGTAERSKMRVHLSELCKDRGLSYKSGVAPLAEYAENMGAAKVVVVLPRTPRNRPHRIYDATASGAAVLLQRGTRDPEIWPPDFASYENDPEERFGYLFNSFGWMHALEMRERFVGKHSWATRAAELRALLAEELSL
jgi:hypothetical protein